MHKVSKQPLQLKFIAFLVLTSLFCQVAAQQGQYLATCFNKMQAAEENPEGPIRIRGEGRHRFNPFRCLFCIIRQLISFPNHLCIFILTRMHCSYSCEATASNDYPESGK